MRVYHYRRVPIDLCNPDAFGENLVRPPLGNVNRHHRQKAGGTNAAPDHAPFTIDEFKFGEAQEETYMIEAFARDLGGEFFILAQEGQQFELVLMREKNLRRRRVAGGADAVTRPPLAIIRRDFV
jgi:hypothetical protein